MDVKKYFEEWLNSDKKFDYYHRQMTEVVSMIEEEKNIPINRVNLYECFPIICKYYRDATFEMPVRIMNYLIEFQMYLLAAGVDVDVTLRTVHRVDLLEAYMEHYEQYVIYNKERLIEEMLSQTDGLDDDIIAVTESDIDQAVIYLTFIGYTFEEIYNLTVDDVIVEQNCIKFKNPVKYIVESNEYIMKLFKKLVFTRWFAKQMTKTNRIVYTKMDSDYLICNTYRIGKEFNYKKFEKYYSVHHFKAAYLHRISLCGKFYRAIQNNIQHCGEELIPIEKADKLICYLMKMPKSKLGTNRSMFYYCYVIYKIIFQKM